jgi:hypothetical protein
VTEHQHLLAADLARRLELALEHDVEGGRRIALVEEELPRGEATLAARHGETLDLVVAEAGEDRDFAQAIGRRLHRPMLVHRRPGPDVRGR